MNAAFADEENVLISGDNSSESSDPELENPLDLPLRKYIRFITFQVEEIEVKNKWLNCDIHRFS